MDNLPLARNPRDKKKRKEQYITKIDADALILVVWVLDKSSMNSGSSQIQIPWYHGQCEQEVWQPQLV